MSDPILLPIQLLLSIFLIFALSRVVLRFKEGKVQVGQFLFWIGVWGLAFFTIFYPDFTSYWAQLLGIGRGADAILYASVIMLSYLVFRLYVYVEDVRHDITTLVREIALVSAQKSGQKHKKHKAKR